MLVRLVVLSSAAACSFGCGSMGKQEVTASAVRDPIIQDIPKPSGFRLVDERSVARASGQFRVAKCEYVGSTGRDSIARFYEEYMPSAGFELRHKSFYNGEFELRFESERENCTVSVRPRSGQTVIVIDVGPKAQGKAERNAPPPVRRPQAG